MKPKIFFYYFLLLVLALQFHYCNTKAGNQRLKTGVYVNEKDPEHYLELKVINDDSLFYYSERFFGNYQVKGDILILNYEGGEGKYEGYYYKDGFLIRDGEKLVLWKGGNTRSAYRKKHGLWVNIYPGWIEEDLTLTQRGEVIFAGNKIGEFQSFDPSAAVVQLSQPSPKKSIALCLFADDKGGEQAYFLDMKNKKLLPNFKVEANVDWISWSPDENYAVTAMCTYDGSWWLNVINITRDKITKSSYVSFKLAKEKEDDTFDLESLRWISPKIFQVRVNITCNYWAYEDEPPENYPCRDGKDILRSYDAQVNASTLAVSYKRIK